MSFQDLEVSAGSRVLPPDEDAQGEYAVKLPVFEGPLDLLLHLIRQNEVEITEIPIAQISAQYLQYMQLMRELNLDVAGEYLVMAATLALIKSRMLLPSEDDEDEALGGDPRAELIRRLLEYERYKEVADELGKRRLLGRDIYEARVAGLEKVSDADRELEVGLFELLDAFRLVLENAAPDALHEVESETISVRDRMVFVMEAAERTDSLEFNRIFESESGALPSRPLIIATFLAILELARLAALHIYQGVDEVGAPDGPIRVRRSDNESDGPDWRQRISDLM